jgi:hypothetical protein
VIPNAMFKYLCGYRSLKFTNPRYLADEHEELLSIVIDECARSHKALTKDEVISKVSKHTTHIGSSMAYRD